MAALPLLLALTLPTTIAQQDAAPAPWLASRSAIVREVQSALTLGAERRAAPSMPEEVRRWQAATRAALLGGFSLLPGPEREALRRENERGLPPPPTSIIVGRQ